MNDLNKPWKDSTGTDEKRSSRRPMWRSLKVVTNVGASVESSNINRPMDSSPSINNAATSLADEDYITATTTNTANVAAPKPASIKTVDYKKTRLSSWLNQQFYEHEGQNHCSPSWIDDREPPAMSNLSLVSHSSSVNDNDGRNRPPSVSDLLLQPVDHPILTDNNSAIPPLSPPPLATAEQEHRPIETTSVAMMYPSSATSSTVSDHSPLTTPVIMDDHSFTHSFGTLELPATTAMGRQEIEHDSSAGYSNHNNYDGDDDDDDNDTFTTASGSNSFMNDMDNRQDKNNIDSTNNEYDINQVSGIITNDSITSSNNISSDDNDETHSTPFMDNDDNDHNYQFGGRRLKHRTSSMQALYVNSIMDAMDPEVAQVLLEWRRQSLLNVDWFDLFSVKSEIWRSSTIFHLHPTQLTSSTNQQQLDLQSSSHSSIATSLISLDYKGIPMEKAFRSYSDKIDYAKASVLDIDQALKVFAQLYWECNPDPLFRSAELVYIVVHSLMLLVTDIHAGQERITTDDFCTRTIDLILDHQASIPLSPFDMDDGNTWQQSMIEYLQPLYKSFSRSNIFPLDHSHLPEAILCYQQHYHPHQQKQEHHPNEEPIFSIQPDAEFDNMFINTIESPDVRPSATHKQPSLGTTQKKQKRNQRRRSKSLNSPPSWTLVRRRDTQRAKVGPYKEGPLSCQLNGEEWKMCWVILHHGHLYVYHHKEVSYPILKNPLNPTTSSVSLETGNKNNKFKQKLMHHITSSSTNPTTNNNISPAASHGQLKTKEPYQVVDIYLGNAFCEKSRPHAFSLQLVNGNSYVFDCGSENHVALWIQDCNYWAARETKIVLSRGLLPPPPPSSSSSSSAAVIMVIDPSLSTWKRPPPPAGASVLDKKAQQEAIDTHLLYLQTELKILLQYEPGASTLPAWHDKKMYLELEIRKYQCYHDSIYF